jgi:hypothetical protein
MDETIEHLFRYVEEKIVGLEMLLKHGKGYSKNYDQQLFKSVDFYVIDYEIYKCDIDSVKRHTGYLLDKYYSLFNNEIKLTKLASLDEDGLEFSTIFEVTRNLKNSLNVIIIKLKEYRDLVSKRDDLSNQAEFKNGLKVSVINFLIGLEINSEPIFHSDSNHDLEQLKASIINFIDKKSDQIVPIINIHTPNRKEYFAYYVVCRLAELSGIPYFNIKNVSINGEPYQEVKGMRHRSKYNKKIKEETYTEEFEVFINAFEESIKEHLA